MDTISYFKLQAKNLFRDYKTKRPYADADIHGILHEYTPKYFDIDGLICDFDINEDNFTLMGAQHIIAYLAGFRKWTCLIKASKAELEFGKLLFENQEKSDSWMMYIQLLENGSNKKLNTAEKHKIFKDIFLNREISDPLFPTYLK